MTLFLTCDSSFKDAGKDIISGKVAIFPTDTVFGLGTNPRSAQGVATCYKIKKRDMGKKMPLLVSGIRSAKELALFGRRSTSLASTFWPGKLSIVLPVKDRSLPRELVGENGTIALRVPNHDCCLRLIASCGGFLIGTSANISGEDPLTNPQDPRLVELSKSADIFVAGPCGESSGVSSTIVDATTDEDIRVVREGAIPRGEIFAYLEKISKTDFS